MGLDGYPRDVATDEEVAPVKGSFFGQSSFSEVTIISERSIVNVSGHFHADEELKLLLPLGCGLRTGAGAIIKLRDLSTDNSVANFGPGAIRLAAVVVSPGSRYSKVLSC